MSATWPADLPQALQVDNYNEALTDGLIESQSDYGPPLTRRRTSSSARPLAGTIIMTMTQVASLETFFSSDLAGGSLPFQFPDPRGGPSLLVKLQKGKLPSWSARSDLTLVVSLNLWVLP